MNKENLNFTVYCVGIVAESLGRDEPLFLNYISTDNKDEFDNLYNKIIVDNKI